MYNPSVEQPFRGLLSTFDKPTVTCFISQTEISLHRDIQRTGKITWMLTRVFFGWLLLSSLEELDGGVSADAILLGQFGLFRGVHLTQADGWTLSFQQASSFGVLWHQGLAVTTPWGICRGVRSKFISSFRINKVLSYNNVVKKSSKTKTGLQQAMGVILQSIIQSTPCYK